MRILVLDTETTGLEPESHGVVEYAHCVLDTETGRTYGHTDWLCDPGVPCSPEARAVHHITDEMTRGKMHVRGVLSVLDFSRIDAYAAHNAEYDRSFVGQYLPERPWICTWRVSMHVWPDAPSHKNQVLRYWLGLQPDFPSGVEAMGAHRALYDVCTTACVARAAAAEVGAEALAELSVRPVLLGTVRFGKYRGAAWSSVPRDYLGWILRQADMDSDVRHTAQHWLAQERAA